MDEFVPIWRQAMAMAIVQTEKKVGWPFAEGDREIMECFCVWIDKQSKHGHVKRLQTKIKTVLSMYRFPQTTLLCTRSQNNHNGSVKAGEWSRRRDRIRRCGLRRRLISFNICKHTEVSNEMSAYMDLHGRQCSRDSFQLLHPEVYICDWSCIFFLSPKGWNNIQLPLYVTRERRLR